MNLVLPHVEKANIQVNQWNSTGGSITYKLQNYLGRENKIEEKESEKGMARLKKYSLTPLSNRLEMR